MFEIFNIKFPKLQKIIIKILQRFVGRNSFGWIQKNYPRVTQKFYNKEKFGT